MQLFRVSPDAFAMALKCSGRLSEKYLQRQHCLLSLVILTTLLLFNKLGISEQVTLAVYQRDFRFVKPKNARLQKKPYAADLKRIKFHMLVRLYRLEGLLKEVLMRLFGSVVFPGLMPRQAVRKSGFTLSPNAMRKHDEIEQAEKGPELQHPFPDFVVALVMRFHTLPRFL